MPAYVRRSPLRPTPPEPYAGVRCLGLALALLGLALLNTAVCVLITIVLAAHTLEGRLLALLLGLGMLVPLGVPALRRRPGLWWCWLVSLPLGIAGMVAIILLPFILWPGPIIQ